MNQSNPYFYRGRGSRGSGSEVASPMSHSELVVARSRSQDYLLPDHTGNAIS